MGCRILLPLLCLLSLGFVACAGKPVRQTTLTTPLEGPAPVTTATPKVALDSDGDSTADDQDSCPLEAAETPNGCPDRYGYFLVRVLNGERLPVAATLAFQPVVNRIVMQDDGYSGMLRPGVYHVRAEADGYIPFEMMFEVQADQKALVEIVLKPAAGE